MTRFRLLSSATGIIVQYLLQMNSQGMEEATSLTVQKKKKKSLENQTQLLWVSVEVSATDGISETMHVLLRLNFP